MVLTSPILNTPTIAEATATQMYTILPQYLHLHSSVLIFGAVYVVERSVHVDDCQVLSQDNVCILRPHFVLA